ncbi:putative transcriptional regulator YdeE [Allocatelliglobosispora scoriae]|uniref:Putative transcriptional regulator YdeE n=1 Tax=Allocatelliglobosispora scoriae TaxID=643052 RepID=A0A841BF83_9ACTN|nr:GyrI-like domain-containing protein [Allocatelliglobosispora scoriae]MBB5867747.1 putative transcriptional regulator YdeE [Allocatelliglobosispora scoriae]
MEIVRRDRRSVIGIEVVADFDELSTAVPAAWTELFARRNELPPPMDGAFVEVSAELGEGRYREVVGVTVPPGTAVPDGMHTVDVPAGRFVSHRHDGAVGTIADGFGTIYDWAERNTLRLGGWKVDHGYQPGFSHTDHELLIDVLD